MGLGKVAQRGRQFLRDKREFAKMEVARLPILASPSASRSTRRSGFSRCITLHCIAGR